MLVAEVAMLSMPERLLLTLPLPQGHTILLLIMSLILMLEILRNLRAPFAT
jgi:hypothetical protein